MARHYAGKAASLARPTASLRPTGCAANPAVLDAVIQAREVLHLMLLLDHDVTDGTRELRFVSRVPELLETGSRLTGEEAASLPEDHAGLQLADQSADPSEPGLFA